MLLETLERATRSTAGVRFLPDERLHSFEELWRSSETAGRYLGSRVEAGGCVAMMLDSSAACVAALVGAWRSGLSVASLPFPGRGVPIEEYTQQIRMIVGLLDAQLLLADSKLLDLALGLGTPLAAYETCGQGGPHRLREEPGDLVQFTSGSTSRPKGVRLSLAAPGLNASAIVEVTEMRPGDLVCSWLPLSHDMGLVGTLLTSWVASGVLGERGVTLVLIPPQGFLTNPLVWPVSCSRYGATHSVSPDFGFRLSARLLPRARDLDLSSMRACISGAEPVRAETLRAFLSAAEPWGFSPVALCPAYGLAEASLAVTMVPPGECYETLRVDASALGADRWVPAGDDDGVEVVSCGRPLRGQAVRISAGEGELGEIQIAGESLLSEYVGAELELLDGEWLATCDRGCFVNDGLIVAGRSDDILLIAGRNLYVSDLESVALPVEAIRPGNCVAVADDRGGYAIVAEHRPQLEPDAALREACRAVRDRLSRRFGAGPSAVVIVQPGSLFKTPSGKQMRHRTRQALLEDALRVVERVDFHLSA